MLYGAAAASDLGLLGDGRIVFHFVCDEETGGAAGSTIFATQGLIDSSALAMVTAEPTGGVVWNAEPRSDNDARRRARTRGPRRPGAPGRQRLRKHDPGRRTSRWTRTRAARAAHGSYPMESDEAAARCSSSAAPRGGGANFNVVPGSAWFTVDRRFNPEEDLDEEVARLTDTIAEAAARAEAEVMIDVLQRASSASTDETHPAAVVLARCIAQVEGASPRFEMCPGVLETRWYAELGIPAFAYGAGRLDVSHGPDEFIDELAMRRCAAVYALFAGELPQ